MQPKLLCRSALVLCTLTALFLFGGNVARAATTYYSVGSLDPTEITSWKSSRDGTGSSPADFATADQIFAVQNGHNMTPSTTWTVSGSGSKVLIETGGKITTGSFNHSITLDMESGAEYSIGHTGYGNLNIGNWDNNSTIRFTNNGVNIRAINHPNVILDYSGSLSMSATRTFLGDVTKQNTGTFNIAGTSVSGTLNIGGALLINGGTFSTGDAAGTLNFTNSGKASGNITVTSGTLTLGTGGTADSVNVNSSRVVGLGSSISIGAGSTFTVNGTLNTGTNVVSGAGAFTLNSGATLGIGSPSGIASSGATGNIQVAGTRTFDSGANYTYNGSAAQNTGDGLSSSVNNLTLDNSFGVTLDTLTTVNGTLTLTNGKLDTGSSILELGCSANVSGASSTKYILGNLKKNYCATGSFTYPTGTTNGYSPVDVTLTALPTNPSGLQIKAVQSNLGGLADAKALDRYWTLTETGDLTANLTFNYLDGDVDGAESDYRVYRGTTDMCGAPCVDTTNNKVSVTGINAFSNWSAGEGNAPTNIVLAAFKLKATTKPSVKVKWETGTELAVVGFNVYRATKLNGTYKLLNVEMIDPKSPGQNASNQYTYTDKRVKHGKTYYYQLEVIQASAPTEWSDIKKIKVP